MTTKIQLQNIADTAITAITALGAPKITQIGYPGNDTAADTAGGQTITLTGSGFQSGLNILIGSVSASVVTFVSSTQVTFVSPSSAAGTYVMYVINPDGGTGISIPGISYSGTPAWTTAAGSLGSVTETAAIATTVAATGDAPVTYTLFSGTVPPGSTLNSTTGLLSGTAPASAGATTYSFVIRATDAQNQDTDRSFSLTINSDVVTWSAPSTGTTVALTQDTAMANISLTAVSAAGAAVTYTANALPTGVTLNGGVISGTPTVAAATVTALTATSATTRTAVNVISWTVSVGGDSLFRNTTLLLPGTATTFVQDASTNNFPISVVGDTRPNNFGPYTPGYYSNFFDGTGDYLSFNSSSSCAFGTNDFTVEFWLYPQNNNVNLMDVRTTQSAVPWGIDLTSGNIPSWYNGSSNNGSTAISQQSWSHVAFCRQGTTHRIFLNGVQTHSWTDSTNYGTMSSNGRIGASQSDTRYFAGYISNLRVVKGTAVYTAAFIPPTAPLTAVAGTVLLTCQSNRFVDNSTNNFAISRFGDVRIDGFDPFVPATEFLGRGSTFFDGNGDSLTYTGGSSIAFGTSDFTIETWAYLTNTGTFTALLRPDALSTVPEWGYDFSNSSLKFQARNGAIVSASVAMLVNQWVHIAVSRAATTLRQFINGIQVSSTNDSTSFASTTDIIRIGGSSFSAAHGVNGYLSNFRVVKGTAVYTANFTPPTGPLTAVTNTSLLTCQTNQPNNNNMFLDSSTNNLLVTRNGNTTQGSFSPYGGGWSNYFDGTGDYLIVPDNAALQMASGNFTIEFWINFSSIASYQTVYDKGYTGAGALLFQTGLGNGRMVIYANGSAFITESGTAPTGTWIHYALVRNGSTLTLYRDGASSGSATNSTNFNNATNLAIGAGGAAATGGIGMYSVNGYMSNLRVVKGTAVYTTNFTPPTQPLQPITGTALLTCADNRFIDDSINNFAITRTGDVSVQKFNPFGIQTAMTPTSHSAFFDGSGDVLTVPDSDAFALGSSSFTMECWIYPTATNANFPTIAAQYGGSFFWSLASMSVVFYLYHSGGALELSASGVVVLNTWSHHAVVRNTTTNSLTYYVNGVSVATVVTSVEALNSTRLLSIGNSGNSGYTDYPFTGYISNFRLVRGTAVYTANFTPSTTPLTAVANTSLLTCQSSTLIDNSTNRFAITAAGDARPVQINPFGFTTGTRTNYTPQVFGGSMYFDGTGDYLTVPNNVAFDFSSTNFTMECWVYLSSVSSEQHFFGKRDSSSSFSPIIIGVTAVSGTNRIYFIGSINNGWQINSSFVAGSIPIPANQWTHLAYVRNNTTFTGYVNGVSDLVITGISGSLMTNNVGASIGASAINGPNPITNGYLSNFRITKGQAVYTSNFTPPTSPLDPITNTVLLLNGTSAAITDASTSNNLETVGDARISTVQSKFGGSSMFFDGTGDYLIAPNSPSTMLGTGDFTIEFWLNTSGGARYVEFGNGLLYRDGNGKLVYYASNATRITSTEMLLLNSTWVHIALVRQSGSSKLYINGIQTGSTFADTINYTLGTLVIGTDGGSKTEFFAGHISDLRITRGVARYTTTFTPPTTAFIAM